MQLIDADTDIGVQVKMSTIQQESLEKFSLLETMCDNTSEMNGNEECSRKEDPFELSKEKAEVDEQIAQHITTSQKPTLNKKKCEDYDRLNGKDDDHQNTQIENKDNKNCDIVNKSVITDTEKIELKVRCVDKLINIKNTDKENKNDTVQANSEKDNCIIDNDEERGVNDPLTEDLKKNSDKKDQFEKPQENIEMHVPLEESEKVEGHETKAEIEEGIEENSYLEHKINNHFKEDIELNVTIKEQNISTEDSTEGNQRESPHIVMDVPLEEHDKEVHSIAENEIDDKTKYTIGKEIEDDIEMNKTLGNQNEENIVMDVVLEEQKQGNNSVAKDKIEKVTTDSSKMEDTIYETLEEDNQLKLDVTLEVPNEVNISVTEEKIEEDKLTKEDIGMSVLLKGQNKLTSIREEITDVNIAENSEIRDKNEENMDTEVSFEEHHKVGSSITEDKIDEETKEGNKIETEIETPIKRETEKTLQEQNKVNIEELEENKEVSETDTNIDNIKKDKNTMNNIIVETDKEKNSVTEDPSKDEIEKNEFEENKNDDLHDELNGIVSKIQDKLEEEEYNDYGVKDKPELENEIMEIHGEEAEMSNATMNKQEEQNIKVEDTFEAQKQGENQIQEKVEKVPRFEMTEIKVANVDEESSDNNKHQKSKDISEIEKNNELREIPQVGKPTDESGKMQEHEDENEIANEKVIVDKEQKIELNDNEKKSTCEETDVRMDTDEVIDIADEKDEEVIEKQSENMEKTIVSEEKSDSGLNNIQETKNVTYNEINDKSASELPVRDTNDQQFKEKKKLTHISKLSNTLDILSDEEDDEPKDSPQKESTSGIQCTSINLDDDDDVMLIDEDPSPNDIEMKTDTIPQPEQEKKEDILQKEESKMESEDKEEQSFEISGNKTGTTPTEVEAPCIDEKKTSDPEQDAKSQDEVAVPKKPLVYGNFLKTYKKNLGDMTRDELEEFCILKIVEGVVDRSNLGEVKSQLKALTQNIEEYKKKAAMLTKQNRDLQVVLKSVQEEQKKKTNMPITPLKITRSVGMQVLMNDEKVPARKKILGANINAANSGPNRQGKVAQNQTKQKVNTNNNTATIPVPRLVPAVNNSNLNTVKVQSPNANTPGKPPSPTVNNSPVQPVPNSVTALPAQRPEKRPHSRMQQSNSFTVDLTDDEPPAKVITRNASAPVRLVPPQNLLAPNRQPFGANANSPRKVYIPISGSQGQVSGVRPGQTIMLRAISPQGPRQRLATPAVAKPNATSNTIRMQRVPSRHPAPLPDSVKQYQPLNWKALPPAPELKLSKVDNGIVISWTIHGYQEENYEEIASYQLYAYQETSSPPSTTLWKKIGDVKALPLPMACTLTQFMAGYKYYFAVRAVDIRSRLGPFSLPGSILLLNKM